MPSSISSRESVIVHRAIAEVKAKILSLIGMVKRKRMMPFKKVGDNATFGSPPASSRCQLTVGVISWLQFAQVDRSGFY